MKLLALYLPQFHRTPENDAWWGEGYTEWIAVKNAKPMYRGHQQPKVPLDDNYYDLSDETGAVWQWQADLANEYGVYGFCIYHYWLGNGKQLLQKPMEILLNHPEIDINYCVCWANHDWTRAWYGVPEDILCKQEYGDEQEWRRHFDYLLQFFKDKRYIKIDNKPMVNIYDSKSIDFLNEMKEKWDQWAIEEGFDGIYLVSAALAVGFDERHTDSLDSYYLFEPEYTYYNCVPKLIIWLDLQKRKLRMLCGKIARKNVCGYIIDSRKIYKRLSENVRCYLNKKVYLGIFPQWDNTPRRHEQGKVYIHSTPEMFGRALRKIARKVSKDDFVYLDAWNEWGEGNYIEPDKQNKYAYLEAIRKVVK